MTGADQLHNLVSASILCNLGMWSFEATPSRCRMKRLTFCAKPDKIIESGSRESSGRGDEHGFTFHVRFL